MSAVEFAWIIGRARPGLFLFGFIIPLAIIALVVYGVWELARSRSTTSAAGVAVPAGSARVLLDERFARGEIDAEDYVQRRTLLDGTPVVTSAPPPVVPSPDAVTGQHPIVAPPATSEDPPTD